MISNQVVMKYVIICAESINADREYIGYHPGDNPRDFAHIRMSDARMQVIFLLVCR